MTREVRQSNDRLALVLRTSHIGLWVYHVPTQTFEWLDKHGKITHTHRIHEIVNLYSQEDFDRLREGLDDVIFQRKDTVSFIMHVKTEEKGGRDYNIDISVLRRDRTGKPVALLGSRVQSYTHQIQV